MPQLHAHGKTSSSLEPWALVPVGRQSAKQTIRSVINPKRRSPLPPGSHQPAQSSRPEASASKPHPWSSSLGAALPGRVEARGWRAPSASLASSYDPV
ncbi:hypothetical protein DACRYDRAFT_25128 [Dacryopinax primogenitus]|uniref:Uncharacterized protein n=1 Tax=Dacryopinax primogenitus (strain DJM 731) TaxID=1858805 RepID=M5FR48_DACPD|nr:uncharacterized protein DACRYDRAFT_25128 [Dacryopinax primogenitus]EJT97344.1 hypothetical protein DACRYDRAFT_25128 [Dacryopinax primogenitus]